MKRFAFYGRVSTEDQQDPASSKAWQLRRAEQLVGPIDGVIVESYFDIGQSRSLPWKRRPQATRLLAAFRDAERGFDAVVIGEPQRAFYGSQFALTYPVFVHYGVELWVPEIGGAIDPGSDAHDLVMSLYGGMSKGERNRIKLRVRTAMAAQAETQGRFLGGRPPYGYSLGDAGAHPNPSKAALGQRLRRLELDPVAAPVVKRIFSEYGADKGLLAIAEGLTRDGIPSPSAHDPARNRHRLNSRGAWSKGAIRSMLRNPRYTGREVWNKQRRDEVLLDVEDVAAGHETRMRWNDPSEWVWSERATHEAIVSPEEFARVQVMLGEARRRPTSRKRPNGLRHYLLSGRILCGICDRRMQGTWNHERPHYRCAFPSEYARVEGFDHPRTVYLREDRVVRAIDEWLVSVFDPAHLEATCAAMEAAGEVDPAAELKAEAARRRIADCDARLARYRSALDAGADPVVVAGWVKDVETERKAAEHSLPGSDDAAKALTRDQLRDLVLEVHDAVTMLQNADPALKAELYDELGLQLTYKPEEQLVIVESRPACRTVGVGGGISTLRPRLRCGQCWHSNRPLFDLHGCAAA